MLEDGEHFKIRIGQFGLEFELWRGALHSSHFHTFAEVHFWGDKKFILGSIEEKLRVDLFKVKYLDDFHNNNIKLGKSKVKQYEKIAGRNVKRGVEIPDDGYLC